MTPKIFIQFLSLGPSIPIADDWGVEMSDQFIKNTLKQEESRLAVATVFASAFVYPFWSLFAVFMPPTHINGPIERLYLGLSFVVLGVLVLRTHFFSKHRAVVMLAVALLCTFHQFTLLYRTGGDFIFVYGCSVSFVAFASVMRNIKSFYAYFIVSVLGIICMWLFTSNVNNKLAFSLGLTLSSAVTAAFATGFMLYSRFRVEQKVTMLFKQIEASEQKQRQVSKSETVHKLAAGIAHEINNPLAIIVGSVRAIKRLSDKKTGTILDWTKYDSFLDRINGSCTRIGTVVNRISVLAPNNSAVSDEKVNIHDALLEIFEKGRRGCSDSLIKLDFSTPEIKSGCLVPKGAIVIVLQNLFENALEGLQHSPNKMIRMGYSESQNGITVFVENSSNGESLREVETLIDPFYTTKANRQGLGLTQANNLLLQLKTHLNYEHYLYMHRFSFCLR